MEEIWRPIKNFEGLYEVSNCGRVKSLSKTWVGGRGVIRSKDETFLKLSNNNSKKYYRAGLSKNGKCKWFSVHRLVLSAFSENVNNLPEINHIDGNKSNNNLDNLEWISVSDNTKHAFRLKLRDNTGINCPSHKLNEDDIREIRSSTLPVRKLAEKYNVNRNNIYYIKKNITWKHI